mmetsp:Transcript_32296/g.49105  ORF Transcript_32296/g.49105 Transcript_32296/m.49105 type:complete len:291 (-) Transcript_32296:465-1337(-)
MEEEKDNRPLVKDLLEKHASQLVELRNILEKEESYSKDHYDNLWMLRFLLSHKKVSKASAAAISTMNFRKERKINELGDIRHKMIDHLEAETSDRNFEIHRKHMKFCHSPLAIIYALPDPDRGLIQILTPKYMDQENFVKEISLEETVEVTLYGNEIIFQVLDDITRRTGKLTKLLRITDLTDYALKDVNLEYLKRHSAATKALEDHYPGLLGSSIVNNPPTWCNATWKVIKHLFPKRVQERVAFVSPNKNPKDAKCFLKYVVRENLWEKFGGNNPEWPPASPSQLWKGK